MKKVFRLYTSSFKIFHRDVDRRSPLPYLTIWCIAWPIYLLRVLQNNNKFINIIHSNSMKKTKRSHLHYSLLQTNTKISYFPNEDEILDTQKIYKYLTAVYVPTGYYWEFYFYFTNFFVS